jgi:hypothetical protein
MADVCWLAVECRQRLKPERAEGVSRGRRERVDFLHLRMHDKCLGDREEMYGRDGSICGKERRAMPRREGDRCLVVVPGRDQGNTDTKSPHSKEAEASLMETRHRNTTESQSF